MKLLFCKKCQDVIKLSDSKSNYRTCMCGKSWGYYKEDGLNAVVSGPCVALGINNSSLAAAVRAYYNNPNRVADECCGGDFQAFVIYESAKTVTRK